MGDLINLFPNDDPWTEVTCCFDCPYVKIKYVRFASPMRMDFKCSAIGRALSVNTRHAPKGDPPDWCPLRDGPVTVQLSDDIE